jgi:periodic tryptophan protein 1
MQFGPDRDVGMRFAVAGSAGSVKVWDLSTSMAAWKAFGVSGRAAEEREEGKVFGVVVEDINDDDGENENEGEKEDGWENTYG